VTGAATGIEEAIAFRLAEAGASVAVFDLNLAGAELVARSLPNHSFAVRVDVSDVASVRLGVEAAHRRSGQIDILVNNAGIAGRAAYVWKQTDEDWQRNIAINLTGVFNCCRAVAPIMRSRGYGRIVNVASIAGKEGNPRMAPYSATNAGASLSPNRWEGNWLRREFASTRFPRRWCTPRFWINSRPSKWRI